MERLSHWARKYDGTNANSFQAGHDVFWYFAAAKFDHTQE